MAAGASGLATDLRLIGRLLPYVLGQRRLLPPALALYPLSALCVVLPPYVIQQILDRAVHGGEHALLPWAVAVYLAAVVLEYVFGFAAEYLMSLLGQRAMARLREDLFARVIALDARSFDTTPQGRLLTRLTNDVEALSELFSTGAVSILSDLVTLTSVVGMMLLLSPKLTALAFVVVPPTLLTAVICQRFARDAFRRIRRHLAAINSFLAEHLTNVELVQVSGQQKRMSADFRALGQVYCDANRQAIFFDAALYALIEAIGTMATAALIGWSAGRLTAGALTAGLLVAFVQYIRRFFVPIRDLSAKYTVLQSALAAAERVVASLEAEPRVADPAPAGSPAATPGLGEGLRLAGVWFAYGDDKAEPAMVLRGVDLHVARGEKVALVGATGSGKSTILRLLTRFYDVDRGVVSVGGVDVRQLSLTGLRRLFGVVLQDTYFFTGTLLDNLALAPSTSPAAVQRAIDALAVGDLIAGVEGGLAGMVGEGGGGFSAGQKQLLAMVRALAIDPEVLLLDEATSNIDSQTEGRLQAALTTLMASRTAVVVAHRLSTVETVDRIVVVDGGRVVEQGNHAELLARGGAYEALVRQVRIGTSLAGDLGGAPAGTR